MTEQNIVLIGMPAAGKSTVGKVLAERTQRQFIDTDQVIEAATGKSLSALIAALGLDGFRRIEERAVASLEAVNAVISTGGSVVYSARAMRALAAKGRIVFLDVPLRELEARVGDPAARGMVIAPGQSFAALYAEREPLYRHYAEVTVDASGVMAGEVVERVLDALER